MSRRSNSITVSFQITFAQREHILKDLPDGTWSQKLDAIVRDYFDVPERVKAYGVYPDDLKPHGRSTYGT